MPEHKTISPSLDPSIPTNQTGAQQNESTGKPKRIASIDAFRGFTIFAMIFVIHVSGFRNLPLTFPHFDSAPVSTFKHAGEDGEEREWAFWENKESPTIYRPAKVLARNDSGKYRVAVLDDHEAETGVYDDVTIRHAIPPKAGDKVIAIFDQPDDSPRFCGIGNGCTFTDWVAPFFVFIVGMCIPLSRRRRGANWWRHVGFRTIALIIAGVIYISLILKLSWWWGILQAIGIAYFMGAASMFLPPLWRWIAAAAIIAFHGVMSWNFTWWTSVGDLSKPFLTIAELHGDPLRPLNVHCTPWGSISYGVITIIGTLLGEALVSRDRKIITRQALSIGIICCVVGYLLHSFSAPMNKDVVSPSYSIFTSGLGALCFLVFYYPMDVWGYKKWAWFLGVFGSNALLAYFMQPVVRIFFKALGLFPYFTGHAGWTGMFWGLMWTGCLWLVVLFCNRRNIYWKL